MNRLFVVSNRLPVTVDVADQGTTVRESSGGLCSALKTVFEKHSGAWVGWPGLSSSEHWCHVPSRPNVELLPIFLTDREHDDFYSGFSNEIIWPLFHDLQSRCNFDPRYWKAYKDVNQRFSETILAHARPDDLVWVHDYHLALVGSMLRGSAPELTTAYFQHIPFPSIDIFEKLPWAVQMIRSMLAFKVLGFQTERDLFNFASCVDQLRVARTRAGGSGVVIEHVHGTSLAQAFPISIDFARFATEAASPEVEQRLASMRRDFQGRNVVLGIDRLDYTKGIPERLRSFARALELYPELRKTVCFVQVVVPSRENIPKYKDLKTEVERLVSEINGRFSDGGWVPIHFIYRHLERSELLAYYRLAGVALITPLKDGMNLVCKEYCAAHVDEDGVLILSQFAGAAADLRPDALVVNPNDYDQVAFQLRSALTMSAPDKKKRMTRLRGQIRTHDVHQWVGAFLRKCQDSGFGPAYAPPPVALRATTVGL